MEVSAHNRAQLELIRELFSACERRKVRFWLFGGWGIDALLGRVTREHSDIDILAETSSRQALRSALESIGGELSDKGAGWRYVGNGVRADISFLFAHSDGAVVSDIDPDDPDVYPWPEDSFPEECNGLLAGFRCRAVSWEAQYVAKAGYRNVFPDISLRAKDESDLETIARYVPEEKRRELEETVFEGIPREDCHR